MEAVVLEVAEEAEDLVGDVLVASTRVEGNFMNIAMMIRIKCVGRICRRLA